MMIKLIQNQRKDINHKIAGKAKTYETKDMPNLLHALVFICSNSTNHVKRLENNAFLNSCLDYTILMIMLQAVTPTMWSNKSTVINTN